MQKRVLERNKITNHSEIEERIIRKNKIARYFKREREIKSANRNINKVSFFNQRIIKCN